MSKIELRNVTLEYNTDHPFLALDNLSLNIEEGEFVCVIGPSGCGKSTLLSLLAGLNFKTSGEVLIDNQPVTGPGKDRCVVFQHYSLFPWLTAKKNVAFGISQVSKKSKKEIEKIAINYLQKVGLAEYTSQYPNQLSGGMQQRVAIARALAMDPEILLMDEPFGAIDTKNRMELQDLLINLCRHEKKRKTVFFVTHDVDEALLLANRIIFMQPKKILVDIKVDFGDKTERSEIMVSDEYNNLRKQLISLFYKDVAEKIGGEEVVL